MMIWIRLNVGIRAHPKILAAGPRAAWQFIASLSYAAEQLTDGYIPSSFLHGLCPNQTRNATRSATKALLKAGLWELAEGGYRIHDYLDYQPSSRDVRDRRAGTAERVRRFRGNALPPRISNAPVTHATVQNIEASRTTLSGDAPPDPTPLAITTPPQAAAAIRALAVQVLDFLNAKTGRHFEPGAANLGLISARLREGATVGQCKGVISQRCRTWRGDDKMAEYLRPKTLFNRTNFAQYKADLPARTENGDGP